MSNKSKPKVTLVIFSCEGREHLLSQTLDSLKKACEYNFSQCILALDGNVDYNYSTKNINPDKVVHNYRRLGYINSILNALSIIETEYFFWLEDDWIFSKEIDINYLVELLNKNSHWVQIRLSKTAPLTQEEKETELCEGVFNSIYGFSANPSLFRTELVKEGFKVLQEASRDERVGFENFLSEWCTNKGIICAVLDPHQEAMVSHNGYLESTPRQWHMTASLDGKTEKYLSGMGYVAPPSFWRKCLMFYKLTKAFLGISTRQFWSRSAYDLAFRIIAVSKDI